MGTNPNWPDRNGSAGGTKDGVAVRHSEDRLNVALPALGWLTNPGSHGNSPRGTAVWNEHRDELSGWELNEVRAHAGPSAGQALTMADEYKP